MRRAKHAHLQALVGLHGSGICCCNLLAARPCAHLLAVEAGHRLLHGRQRGLLCCARLCDPVELLLRRVGLPHRCTEGQLCTSLSAALLHGPSRSVPACRCCTADPHLAASAGRLHPGT